VSTRSVQWHDALQKKKRRDPRTVGFRRSCEGLAYSRREPDRTVRLGAVLTIRPRGIELAAWLLPFPL